MLFTNNDPSTSKKNYSNPGLPQNSPKFGPTLENALKPLGTSANLMSKNLDK